MESMIIHAVPADLPEVCRLFEEAIFFQKENKFIGWKNYDRAFIEKDIRNGLLFKLVNENAITGIFSVCYQDALIWRDKERGDAIYLHRIISNRKFATGKLFAIILAWAIEHAQQNELAHVRMDTWAENTKLIDYYKTYGFRFVENYTTDATDDLPQQHRNLWVALLELVARPVVIT
jgi:hypothetical protein